MIEVSLVAQYAYVTGFAFEDAVPEYLLRHIYRK